MLIYDLTHDDGAYFYGVVVFVLVFVVVVLVGLSVSDELLANRCSSFFADVEDHLVIIDAHDLPSHEDLVAERL